MTKKILSLLLSLAMIVGLTACGSGGDSAGGDTSEQASTTEESKQESKETEESKASEAASETTNVAEDAAKGVDGKTIGVCIYKYDDNFMTLYRTELDRYLTAGGAKVQIMDGKNDQAEQTNQIQNFITQGVDVLIVNLVQSSAAAQITDQCNAAGIPVVFINREPEVAEEERWEADGINATYVGADARQSGTFQGEIIASLPNKGDADGDGTLRYVMVMGDPENVDAKYRTQFSIEALETAGIKVEKLDEQRGDWDQARGQEIVASALAAHGEKIDVVFCNNDAMALGALQAIEAAGRKINEDIYLVGVDALADALESIQGDKMTGTVFNDHFGQSHKAAEMAAKFIAGETVDAVNMVDYIKVTPDNASEILEKLK